MQIDIGMDILMRARSASSSVVVAGHYSLADNMQELSSDGEPEVQSFAVGAHLVAQARHCGCTSRLVVWINDIGVPNGKRQDLKEHYALPDNYLRIIEGSGLDPAEVVVIFESTMRNKASVLARKLFKWEPELFEKVSASRGDLVRCVSADACGLDGPKAQTAYVVEGPTGEPLVVKEGPNPKCNMILATLFAHLRERFSPKLILTVFNDIYAYRLSLGVHVSQAILGNPTPMTSVLCDGQKVYCGASDCLYRNDRI